MLWLNLISPRAWRNPAGRVVVATICVAEVAVITRADFDAGAIEDVDGWRLSQFQAHRSAASPALYNRVQAELSAPT